MKCIFGGGLLKQGKSQKHILITPRLEKTATACQSSCVSVKHTFILLAETWLQCSAAGYERNLTDCAGTMNQIFYAVSKTHETDEHCFCSEKKANTLEHMTSLPFDMACAHIFLLQILVVV